jgi:hypothetical protein
LENWVTAPPCHPPLRESLWSFSGPPLGDAILTSFYRALEDVTDGELEKLFSLSLGCGRRGRQAAVAEE